MIKKTPFNYSNDMDRRRQGLDAIVENLLPDVSTDDAGKIVKVSEAGKWTLGNDENTIIVANPEGSSTDELMNLKVGDTIYAVNKPTFEYIKGIRLTISDGGQYRTDKPKVEFYDDAGNVVTTPTYTSSCDKEYAGNISLNQVCSIATTDAPGVFTYVFDNTMPVTINHLIKLTNAGAFAGDIAKSVKVELTADGENWLELWFDPSIAWSGSSNAYRIIDIKTGEVSNTLLPIVTSADNGKVLGVVNGVWDKGVKLPVPTSGDNGKSITVNSSGVYELNTPTVQSNIIEFTAVGGGQYSTSDLKTMGEIYSILSNDINTIIKTVNGTTTTTYLRVSQVISTKICVAGIYYDSVTRKFFGLEGTFTKDSTSTTIEFHSAQLS